MILNQIKLQNFMAFDELALELPREGLVLVSGENGAGKSTLLEAVAMAFWGESIRDSTPWRDNKLGSVEVHANAIKPCRAIRSHKARGGTSLHWEHGDDETSQNTYLASDKALKRLIPSFELWKRCCVFTSHDVAVFSSATDAERKQLLEEVLGISRFDRALNSCRKDLASAKSEHQVAKHEVENRLAQLASEQRSYAQALATQASLGATDIDFQSHRREIVQKNEAIAFVQNQITARHRSLSEARERLVKQRTQLELLRSQKLRFASGSCPTCNRAVDTLMRSNLTQELESAEREFQRIEIEVSQFTMQTKLQDDEANKQIGSIRQLIAKLDAEIAKFHSEKSTRELIKSQIESAAETKSRIEQELEICNQRFKSAETELRLLERVEQVLGLSGVRSSVLSKALGGLEGLTNSVLQTLAPEISIAIKPTKQNKDESISEKISITIDGAGGGAGYTALSTGQRRRVDVAILLGLSVLAEGSMGQKSDLWFDELLDGLDSEGVSRVLDLIVDLAKDRKVILISHNPELLESLRSHAVLRLEVSNGKIKEFK